MDNQMGQDVMNTMKGLFLGVAIVLGGFAQAAVIPVGLTSDDGVVGEGGGAPSPTPGYYPSSTSTIVGTAGSPTYDANVVFGYTLPVLPVGEVITSASFDFEITGTRNTSGSLPDLHVYVLNIVNPDPTGTALFFHGGADGSHHFVGSTTAPTSAAGTNFADDAQDRSMLVPAGALAYIIGLYGGDHIPDQAEVFFRFNLNVNPSQATLRRYSIDPAAGESFLTLTTALPPPAVPEPGTWALFLVVGAAGAVGIQRKKKA